MMYLTFDDMGHSYHIIANQPLITTVLAEINTDLQMLLF